MSLYDFLQQTTQVGVARGSGGLVSVYGIGFDVVPVWLGYLDLDANGQIIGFRPNASAPFGLVDGIRKTLGQL